MEPSTVISRLETQLRRYDDGTTLKNWSKVCPILAAAPVEEPGDVPGWIQRLPKQEANQVARALVRLAQSGDQAALLATVICLRPGLTALARRMGVAVDDAVTEATIRILEVSLHRRNVLGGLLLDVRNALWRAGQRRRHVKTTPTDPAALAARVPAPGEVGRHDPAAGEQLLRLTHDAWRRGHVEAEQARLVIETRILGTPIAAYAQRHAVAPQTIYARRCRAETRLATVVAWHR